MRVYKGSIEVIKDKKQVGHDQLIGETLTRKNVIIVVLEDKKVMLWRTSLGDISEEGLKVMSEQKLFGRDKVS